MAKIQKMKNGQHFLTLPRAICRALGWDKGDHIHFKILENNEITLFKVEEGKDV